MTNEHGRSEETVDGASAAHAGTLDVSAGIAAGVYELIRGDVVAGRLSPGQRLSEASLGRQYGVSRSPVREALASLERDGLVERRGTSVHIRERTVEETFDIYRVRIYLEGALAADAAQRRHPHDLRRIESALEAARSVEDGDPAVLTRANRAFHDAVARAAHNATLVDLQDRLTAQVATLPSKTLATPGRWPTAKAEHEHIAEAIDKGDADGARAAAEDHMSKALDIRMRMYEQSDSV